MSEVTDMRIDETALEERLAVLEAPHPWSPRVVSKLEVLIRSADDYDLFRINPLRYAEDNESTRTRPSTSFSTPPTSGCSTWNG